MTELQILKPGNQNFTHPYILYVDNGFDGQAWWCDNQNCQRHERIDYSPGEKIRFPPHSLIRTPNPEYGGEETYAFQADLDGRVRGVLLREQRIKRKDVINRL